jgi:hypothetical protein
MWNFSDVTGTETLPLYKHAASSLAETVYIFQTHVVRTWGGTSNILNEDMCDFLFLFQANTYIVRK